MSITGLFTNSAHKQAKRVGRGIAAGQGKTAGRGTKGQKSRSGAGRKIPAWFEGGQTPLFRKLAKKKGQHQRLSPKPIALTTTLINQFYQSGEVVSMASLIEKKLIRPRRAKLGVKIIVGQLLKEGVTVDGLKTSAAIKDRHA